MANLTHCLAKIQFNYRKYAMKDNNKDKLSMEALDLAIVDKNGSDPRYFKSESRLKPSYDILHYIETNQAFQNRLVGFQTEEKRERFLKRAPIAKKKPTKIKNSAETALFFDKDAQHPAFQDIKNLEQLLEAYLSESKKRNSNYRNLNKGKQACSTKKLLDYHVKDTANIVHEMIRVNQSLWGVDEKNKYFEVMNQKYGQLKETIIKQITHFEKIFGNGVSYEMDNKLEQALKTLQKVGKLSDTSLISRFYERCITLFSEFNDCYPWFGDA